jgi:hypothetical protein
MASLVFSQTDLDQMAAIAGYTLYAHLVTAVPVVGNTTVADLTLATGGNYALQLLTSVVSSAEGLGAKVLAANPTWTALTTNGAASIKGVAICRRAGASPASTDKVISYVEASSTYTPPTSSGTDYLFQFPATGFIKTR